jgi:hypothetical protein
MKARLAGLALALVGSWQLYVHAPRGGPIHDWQHKEGRWLSCIYRYYRGVDGHTHQGPFCTDCGRQITKGGHVPALDWPRAMSAYEAKSLMRHVAYNAHTWQSKLNNDKRVRYCAHNPAFQELVHKELLKRGYTEADLARPNLDEFERWEHQTNN